MRTLIALLAATLAAIIVFVGAFAGCAGVAWIFVFGDNPWPSWSSAILLILPAIAGVAAAWVTFRSVLRR
jgi:uncharacterized membrane protein HdeD (DUF308 family)